MSIKARLVKRGALVNIKRFITLVIVLLSYSPLLLSQISSLKSPSNLIYGFVPVVQDNKFYLLKAHGMTGIVIDTWNIQKKDIKTLLEFYQQGKLSQPQRIYLKRISHTKDIPAIYILFSEKDVISNKEGDPPFIPVGLTQKNNSLFIAHDQGIDEIDLEELFEAIDSKKPIKLLSSQALAHATGLVFLNSFFSNELKITSQWDLSKNESVLSVFLEDGTLINQWTLASPILGLSLHIGDKDKARLFSGAGKDGLHVFNIHLQEATLHPNFIKRVDTLSCNFFSSSGKEIGGVWIDNNKGHFSISHDDSFSTLHAFDTNSIYQEALHKRNQKISSARSLSFDLTHSMKSFTNGLLTSIPFDADRLVDAFGFDLEKDLDEQLALYGVSDSIEDSEKEALKKAFSKWKTTGEISGFVTQMGLLSGKIAHVRHLKKIQIETHIHTINRIRAQMGIESSAIPLSEGSQWLKNWNAQELLVSDIAPFAARLEKLKKVPGILLPKQWLELILASEKRGLYVRPLERVLVSQGAPAHIEKLEHWTFKRMVNFFDSLDPKDLKALFPNPELLTRWEHLKRLETLKQLDTFQKVEHFSSLMWVKVGLLKTLQRTQGSRVNKLDLSEKSKKALSWLSQKANIETPQELKMLYQDAFKISKTFHRSEEAYRISRLIELHQKGLALCDLEKLEKLKLLHQSGLWKIAECFRNGESISEMLDKIYDFEQMSRSGYLNRLFRNGKLKETLLFTGYSDLANLAIEIWSRELEGRPLLSTGVAHNLIWNTYIMLPIFAISGLRVSRSNKIFILIANAVSSSYMAQKLSKWGGDVLNTDEILDRWYHRWETLDALEKTSFLLPPPKMPISEIPGYLVRDIFHPDPSFEPKWALFDSAWCIFLSTPRGYGVGALSNVMTRSRILDKEAAFLGMDIFSGVRQTVRMAPVFANETLGAATYTPIYQQFFEDKSLQLRLLDGKFEVIDPWQTSNWERKPRLKLFLAIESSTPPQKVTFQFTKGKALSSLDKALSSRGEATRGVAEGSQIEFPQELWKETREHEYELNWEEEIDYESFVTVYQLKNLTIKNSPRLVGSSLNPFQERQLEEGKSFTFPKPLVTFASAKDDFSSGLLKALHCLSKEAATQFYKGNTHFSAGIVYMIGQYLTPTYLELLIQEESHSLNIDAFKEALKMTRSVNFSDYPITKDAVEQLTKYLEMLSHTSIPEGTTVLISPSHPKQWLNLNTKKVLSLIKEDILKETRGLVFDDGNKNDWYTLQLYKGYCFGLFKLYRWVLFHFQNELSQQEQNHISQFLKQLEHMTTFGKELEESWFTSLTWKDSYLKEFSNQFLLLEELLK